MKKLFELRVQFPNGKFYTKLWEGESGLDACQKYADSHPGHAVFAWRNTNRHGLFIGMPRYGIGS